MANTAEHISFEFFPPKTDEGRHRLMDETTPALSALGPEFYSVTYGAGGATRETTQGVVTTLTQRGFDVAPHLSFGGDDEATIRDLLNAYKDAGVKRLVALRGDMPSGMGAAAQLVYANELVEFIRKETGDHFTINVAAYPEIHPESESYESDVRFLKGKFDAGADAAITQYFYNSDAYFRFVEDTYKLGADIPVVPGIMPISSSTQLMRFSDACGAEIPRWIRLRLQAFGDDTASIKAFGLDVVTDLCDQLRSAGVPALHFYTMNQSAATLEICRRLEL